jgi:hypothetical protein
MEHILSADSVIRIVAREMTSADIVPAAYAAAGWHPELPEGTYGTGPAQAWAGVLSTAIHFGGLALAVHVNGGGMAGMYLATPDPQDKSRLLEQLCAPWGDEKPALLDLARTLAAAAGKRLERKTVTVSFQSV